MAGGKIDGDQKVMAAAQQIMKSLGTKNLTNDMIKALSQLDNRLASIHTNLIEQKIDAVEKVIRRWDSQCSNPRRRNSLRWEDSPFEAAEYLSAVDNVLDLIKVSSTPPEDFEIKERAEIILQQAMCRMEDEFRRIMIRGTGPLDIDRLDRILEEKGRQQITGPPLDIDRLDRIKEEKGTGPLDIDRLDRISEEKGRQQTERVENSTEEGDDTDKLERVENSTEDDDDTDRLKRGENSIDDKAKDTDNNKFVDLINPDAIPKLKEIADRMIKSGYEKECHQAYSSTLREVLDEFLLTLGSEKLSIEEVQKLEWKLLSEKMEKWNQALKSVVKVLLPSEKHLFDQIFGGSNLIREVCFIETSKVSVMQLLNFAEAIVIGKRSSEKLFQILDMHSALADVMPDLQALFPKDSIGGSVCSEAQAILKELGESAKGTLTEFENMVQNEASRKVFQGGDIHPLTRYVMNYVKFLVEYDSLSLLLECGTNDSDGAGGDKNTCSDIISLTPIGRFLRSLFSSLELNLKEKSKMYEDGGLQYVFQMNNILYVVQKVKEDSELGKLLGDNWVRQHRGQVRQYANSYLRAAWSKALSFLKDEGLGGGGSASNVSRLILKERFKSFNACFEEIYRNQTAWKVPDSQLREELRLSISEKVLPAYRSFVGRFHSHLDRGRSAGKYIKYSPDDLEDFLLDLFEGTPAILHHPRRKLSA